MENLLPYQPYDLLYNSSDYGWSDYYGANYIASNYCNLKTIKSNNFFWIHGILEPWLNNNHIAIINHLNNKKMKYFLNDNLQVKALKKNGYIYSYVIGSPIIYLPKSNIERKQKSLLILPIHSLRGDKIKDENNYWQFIEYVKELKSKNKFDIFTVCLHFNDFSNNFWKEDFEKIGINVVQGAIDNDINSYFRIQQLFCQHETTLTNGWGSHVAYSLFFGCKLSIKELKINYVLNNTSIWNHNEENKKLYEFINSSESIKMQQKLLNKFYVSPENAISDINLGKELVGYYHKVSPFKMRLLFGWSIIGKIYWKIMYIKDILRIRTRIRQFIKK
jgi:hypothetical protein